MIRFIWLSAALAAVLTIAPHAHAVSLGTLIDTHGVIEVGDKQFTNFSLHDLTGQNSTPTDPRNLQIDGFTNLLGEHGLRLSAFSVILPNAVRHWPFLSNTMSPSRTRPFGSIISGTRFPDQQPGRRAEPDYTGRIPIQCLRFDAIAS
jgi:hypothetical protein